MRFPDLSAELGAEPVSTEEEDVEALLLRLNKTVAKNKHAAMALRAVVELCAEQGIFDLNELYGKMVEESDV